MWSTVVILHWGRCATLFRNVLFNFHFSQNIQVQWFQKALLLLHHPNLTLTQAPCRMQSNTFSTFRDVPFFLSGKAYTEGKKSGCRQSADFRNVFIMRLVGVIDLLKQCSVLRVSCLIYHVTFPTPSIVSFRYSLTLYTSVFVFFLLLLYVCSVLSPLWVLDAFRTLYLLSVTWRRRGICLLSLWTAGWPPKSGFLAVFLIRHTTTMPTMQAMRKTPAQ